MIPMLHKLRSTLDERLTKRNEFYGRHARSFNEGYGSVFEVMMSYWSDQYDVWPELEWNDSIQDFDLAHGRHANQKRPKEVRKWKRLS